MLLLEDFLAFPFEHASFFQVTSEFGGLIFLCPFVGGKPFLLKSGSCQVAGRRTGDLSCTQILGMVS